MKNRLSAFFLVALLLPFSTGIRMKESGNKHRTWVGPARGNVAPETRFSLCLPICQFLFLSFFCSGCSYHQSGRKGSLFLCFFVCLFVFLSLCLFVALFVFS